MSIVLQLAGEPEVDEPWCGPEDLAGCSGCENVQLDSVCAAATEILHVLSQRRYGLRTVTVRPTRVMAVCACPSDIVRDYIINSGPLPFFGTMRGDGCGCGSSGEFTLNGPVYAINTIKVDGSPLVAETDYHLYGRSLVRMADSHGSSRSWPCCQRLDLPDTEAGTWSIEYTWGKTLPYSGKMAVVALACWLAKQTAQGKCGVPERVTRMDRQGVSYNFDPTEIIKAGRTGVRVTDLWLGTINPSGSRRRARFIGPDSPTGARQ